MFLAFLDLFVVFPVYPCKKQSIWFNKKKQKQQQQQRAILFVLCNKYVR